MTQEQYMHTMRAHPSYTPVLRFANIAIEQCEHIPGRYLVVRYGDPGFQTYHSKQVKSLKKALKLYKRWAHE